MSNTLCKGDKIHALGQAQPHHQRFCQNVVAMVANFSFNTVPLGPDIFKLEDVRTKGHGIETEIRDHGDDVLAEPLMMGLRLTEGVDLVTLAQRIGHQDPFTGRNPLLDRDVVERLVALCLLEWRDNARLAVTSKGRLVLNSIIAELLPQP